MVRYATPYVRREGKKRSIGALCEGSQSTRANSTCSPEIAYSSLRAALRRRMPCGLGAWCTTGALALQQRHVRAHVAMDIGWFISPDWGRLGFSLCPLRARVGFSGSRPLGMVGSAGWVQLGVSTPQLPQPPSRVRRATIRSVWGYSVVHMSRCSLGKSRTCYLLLALNRVPVLGLAESISERCAEGPWPVARLLLVLATM